MKFLEMLFLVTLLTIGSTSFAGVAGYNDSSYKGVFPKVKCADGLECKKDGQTMIIRQDKVKTAQTFTSGDTTPSVANGSFYKTYLNNSVSMTTFDDGYAGQEIIVQSQGAVTYDVTGTTIKCGSTDIVTASGDMTKFLYDGTDWRCTSFIDASDNLN